MTDGACMHRTDDIWEQVILMTDACIIVMADGGSY